MWIQIQDSNLADEKLDSKCHSLVQDCRANHRLAECIHSVVANPSVVEFQGHSLNQWVGSVSVWVRWRGGTNGGGTHSSARLCLRAATGRGELILFDIFPSCAYFLNKGFVITSICSTEGIWSYKYLFGVEVFQCYNCTVLMIHSPSQWCQFCEFWVSLIHFTGLWEETEACCQFAFL